MIKFLNQLIEWYLIQVQPRIAKWVSAAFLLAFGVTALYYYKVIEVAQDLTKQETEQISEDIKTPEDRTEGDAGSVGNETGPLRTMTEVAVTRIRKIDQAAYETYRASMLNNQRAPALRGLYAVSLVLLVLVVIAYLIYRRRKQMEILLLQKDPPELNRLFEEFSDAIAELRTPRKIKRLINKLRFQYNLLEEEKLISKNVDKRFLFDLSIRAELDHGLLATLEAIHGFGHEFYQKSDGPVSLDNQLAKRLYDLNKSVYGDQQPSNGNA